jgi:hypothetical protein
LTNPQRFLEICGDSFVSQEYLGAEVAAYWELRTTDTSLQAQFEAAFKASGGIAGLGAAVEGELKTKYQVLQSEGRTSLRYVRTGGAGVLEPGNEAEVIDAMKSVGQLAVSNPAPFRLVITPYSYLVNWPGSELQDPALQRFEVLARRYWRLNDLWRLTEDISAAPSHYLFIGGFAPNDVLELHDVLQRKIEQVRGVIAACLENSQSDCEVPPLADKPLSLDSEEDEYRVRARLPLAMDQFWYGQAILDIEQQAREAEEAGNGMLAATLKLNAIQLRFGLPLAHRDAVIALRLEDVRFRRCQNDWDDPTCMTKADLKPYADEVPKDF